MLQLFIIIYKTKPRVEETQKHLDRERSINSLQ